MHLSQRPRAILLGGAAGLTALLALGTVVAIRRSHLGDRLTVTGRANDSFLLANTGSTDSASRSELQPSTATFLDTATARLANGAPASTDAPGNEPELSEPGLVKSPTEAPEADTPGQYFESDGGWGFIGGRDLDGTPFPRRSASGSVPSAPSPGPLTNGQSGAARAALAVKIDNAPGSRPHAGINQADVVFEVLVEGGISRFMALFHSEDAAVIGPVRSARTTDLNLLSMLNRPIFAWSGANDAVRQALSGADVVDVGAETTGGTYYRSSGRDIPHNLMSSSTALQQAAAGRGARVPQPLFNYEPPGGAIKRDTSTVDGIEIAVGSTTSVFWWDVNTQRWLREQGGTAHMDSHAFQIAPTSVVVLETEYHPSPADARSPEAQSLGHGRAWVLSGGRAVLGTWDRSAASGTYQLRSTSGQPLKLNPGRTWVSLPTPGNSVRLLGAVALPEATTTTVAPISTPTTRPRGSTTTTTTVASTSTSLASTTTGAPTTSSAATSSTTTTSRSG